MKTTDYKLFIPGPIEVGDDVLQELAEPMMPHFGQEWADIYTETIALTKEIFQTQGEVYVFPGTGSAALDMGIGNLVYDNKSVLVLSNGFFGARLTEIAKGFTPHVKTIEFGFANTFDLKLIKRTLEEKHFDVVLAVHVETSIGVRNPIEEIAELTRATDTVFFVDGVSSVGVEKLLMDDWGVDVCVTASQKGLESPPGLALLAFNAKAWALMETVNRPDWYLNLKIWKKYEPYWGPLHPQLITHAVPIVRAMTVALKRMLSEGYLAHIDKYVEVTEYFRQRVTEIGYELFSSKDYAHGLTAISIPFGKSIELVDYFKKEHQILIGGGLGPAKGKVIRVGHMGPVADPKQLDQIIDILKQAKKDLSL